MPLRRRSDDQLVADFRAGRNAAFEAIHDRYRARISAYVHSMLRRDHHAAEDVVQDVWIRAFGALRADERPMQVRPWLYRIAHNRCMDVLRRPAPVAAELDEQVEAPAGLSLGDRQRLRETVTDIQRLPDQQRSALVLRELEGASYQELAETLDVTVPAVKSLLVRARMGLAEAAEARTADCATMRRDIAGARGRMPGPRPR